MKFNLFIRYIIGDEEKTATNSNEDLVFEMEEKGGNNLVIHLTPDSPIQVKEFYLKRRYAFEDGAKFFANGFQSWTDTKEFSKEEKMPGLGLIGKSPFGVYMGMNYGGDYNFVKPEKKAGAFHSHSLAYVRNGDVFDFFGSLNDRTGYTVIYADMNRNVLRFGKDLEGITIDKKYEVLNLFFAKGTYDEVFDAYFKALDITLHTPKGEKVKGYTSWYNYYSNISEDIILRDLDSLCATENYHNYVNTFQIDDGYQTSVGDWFSIDSKKFPNGMKPMADAIHEKGLQAGLWLAPFGAQKTSQIAKEHPDWLVKGKNGKPVLVGHNWMGFYALDIYNEEARAYIKDVFDVVLNEWGFDLVKLDFLYAAASMPMHGKTRGEIAFDSIDLIRECVGDKKIIACGVQCERLDEVMSHKTQTGEERLTNNGYDISFDHVGFSYEDGEQVLKDVSFTAKQNEVTALIGPSGGGKTTVSRLAARFWDVTEGSITLGGMDVGRTDPEALLSNYSIVFQDVTLFNNSILENIRIGKKGASDEEVIEAARLANCDEFVKLLPDGYNTNIGENGSELSGGERQRISIARAFLKDAPVILLDEATASLDAENETAIQGALSKLIKGKTVLIIAHRMRTIANADHIVVLKDGVVAEEGTPKELTAKAGIYAHMVSQQQITQNWKI